MQRTAGEPRRLRCSDMTDPSQARLLAKGGGDRATISEVFGFDETEALGSIGLKLAAMALGACELYVNVVTALQEGLVASSGPMHEAFLERLSTLFAKRGGARS